jgi:hypothetical protein
MERQFKMVFGKQLRKEFDTPDSLPPEMRKALEVLAKAARPDDQPAANDAELLQTRGGNDDPIRHQ